MTTPTPPRSLLRLAGLALLIAAGCTEPAPAARPLWVLAASSLTEALTDVERAYEEAHPGVDVKVSTAGSQALRLQIEHGARADVFLSAHAGHLAALAEQGLLGERAELARNRLALAVPAENPAGLRGLEDLPQANRIVLGGPEVPVGVYTEQLLARAAEKLGAGFRERVEARVVSRETNVRLVLAKVELGEADAAIVYQTDGAGARRAKLLAIDPALQEPVRYWAGVLSAAPAADEARRFVAWLTSTDGQAVLARRGFDPPSPEAR